MYWNANMLYGWEISQKLLLVSFKYVEEISQFDEDFIKCYNEDSTIAHFLGFDIHYPGKHSQWFTLSVRKNENWKSWKICSQIAG